MPWAACPPLFSWGQQGRTSRPWQPVDFFNGLLGDTACEVPTAFNPPYALVTFACDIRFPTRAFRRRPQVWVSRVLSTGLVRQLVHLTALVRQQGFPSARREARGDCRRRDIHGA